MSCGVSDSSIPISRGRFVFCLALVATSFSLNHVWLGRLFSRSDQIDDFAARVSIWALQAILVLFAALIWRKGGSREGRKAIVLLVVTILFCLAVVIIGAQIIGRPANPMEIVPRSSLPLFKDVEWADAYQEEYSKLRTRYWPYIMWQRRPAEGTYINVGADGTRHTWNPEYPNDETVMQIWVFGGSTAWGSGSRDDYTIPSHLSRLLQESGIMAEVTNFGETGYVFTQEIVRLLMELRTRPAPDLVIFYDGANDVYAAYHDGFAGGFSDFNDYASAHKLAHRRNHYTFWEDVYINTTEIMGRHCYLYQFVNKLPERLQQASHPAAKQADFPEVAETPEFPEIGASMSKEGLSNLSRRIVAYYERSSGLVEGISRGYGFDFVLLWQPVIFLEDKTFEIESLDVRSQDPALAFLAKETRERLSSRPISGFRDLSGALKDRPEPVFFDWCHLIESGNEMVARAVLGVLQHDDLLPGE